MIFFSTFSTFSVVKGKLLYLSVSVSKTSQYYRRFHRPSNLKYSFFAHKATHSLSHRRKVKKGWEVAVRVNQFSALRKAGSCLFSNRDPLSWVYPRGISSEDSGRRSRRKKTDPLHGVEVSRVRKGCESSSCLCSCTLWCLGVSFVSDYGFLSPVCSFSASVQRGRKERRQRAHTGDMARTQHERGPIKVETWFRFSIPSSLSLRIPRMQSVLPL